MTAPAGSAAIEPAAVDGRRRVPLIINGALYLRVFAAASIVWFHIPHAPGREVGGIGLAIFVFLAFMHVGRMSSPGAMLARRARQLLTPWAFWWLVYAGAQVWMARGIPSELASPESIWALFTWPAIHLWFLPFLFVAHLAVLVAREVAAPISAPVKSVLALTVGLILLELVTMTPRLPPFAAQVWSATPAIGLGLVYGYCVTLSRPRQVVAFVTISLLVAAVSVPIWLAGHHSIAVAAVGSSALMVLVALPVPRNRLLMRLARLTLGVYLIHPLAMVTLWKLVGIDAPFWIVAPGTWLLSTMLAWVMSRNRVLRITV
jgi:surface polysaccharide O-acyltransferase-like enzyme